MTQPLDHLAARVAGDPFFLAHPLAEYARAAGLDDPALAAALGCRPGDLARLRLCRSPRPDPADFRADLRAVADRFGLPLAALAAAVRQGQAVAGVRAAAPAGVDGPLLAARDRQPPAGGNG